MDRLIITSFVPPFIVAFSIAMFVLLMQILWLYIDDIAGKGLGTLLILELLGYRSMSLIPMALPLGILISSVMVMGNLAEHYELSSLKSAGVPLIRIIRPLLIFGAISMVFSVYTSNTLIPKANLKFGSRMFDIQQKKPALSLETGTFNDDFFGYAIRIGQKSANGRDVSDVLIYDQRDINTGELTIISARQGEMFTTENGSAFVMILEDGHQYVEQQNRSHHNSTYPYIRTSFSTWEKKFDLTEFALDRTNPELFKSNRQMLTARQLGEAADSIARRIQKREVELSNYLSNYVSQQDLDSTFVQNEEAPRLTPTDAAKDTLSAIDQSAQYRPTKNNPIRRSGGRELPRTVDQPIASYTSFAETFAPVERDRLLRKVRTYARSILNQAESAARTIDRMRESRVKHIYDLHMKYSLAVVCMIFVLIGAPMGAIVRKGGFGVPILVSIIFFMLFVILTIFCRKIAESYVLPAVAAAWLPCAILFPVGVVLTIQAMNDSKSLGFNNLVLGVKKWWRRLRKNG